MPDRAARGPSGTDTNRASIDAGTLARAATPSVGTLREADPRQVFETAVDVLQAELANAGATGAIDGAARASYDALTREFRDELRARVADGKLSWHEAAREAHGLREEVMAMIRRSSTPVGRAVAQWLKPQGPTFNQMIARKTLELFGDGADFTSLSAAQRNRVFAAIVESAGKSNPPVTAMMRRVSRAGRGLLVLSLGIAVYTIAAAEDKVDAAKHEGAVTGAGMAGGIAGGALAGLMCGPGAPVCVTIGAFAGGALAALGVDIVWAK